MRTFEILLFTLAIIIVSYLWRKRRFLYLVSKIPRGTLDTSLRGIWNYINADAEGIYELVNAGVGVHGLSKNWLGPMVVASITLAEDVKIVLSSSECLEKPYFIKFANLLESSAFGSVESWRRHRKILNPFFGPQSIGALVPIFNRKVQTLMSNLRLMKRKGEFNFFLHAMPLALETFLAVMELDVDIQKMEKGQRDDLVHNFELYVEIYALRMLKFWLHPEFIFKRTNASKRQAEAFAKSGMGFTPIIMENVKKILAESNNDEEERPATFIRALMSAKNGLSDAQIQDEINTMLVVAQDTSAIVMSSALLLLAMHKDKQNKVLAELQQVIGAWTEDISLSVEQLNQLVYLDMVLNETMRLLPVGPMILRTNEREIGLSEGYVLPEKSIILIPIFHLHKNSEYWGEDSNEFKPERFEPESFSKVHPYAFLPFAKGARTCLGKRYSLQFIKTALAYVLLKYEVDTSLKLDELKYRIIVTLNVTQGYQISLKERNAA